MLLRTFAALIVISAVLFSFSERAGATPECGAVIKKFDFMTRIQEGEENRVFVSAVNTGSVKDLLIIGLFSGGERVGIVSSLVEGGGSLEAEFSYIPESSGEIEVMVRSLCGGIKREKAFVEVVKIEELPKRETAFSATVKETSVSIRPSDIDVKLGSSKVIEIIIETDGNKRFFVDVSGIPPDWTAYNRETEISGKGKVFVYLTPKQKGMYSGHITVYSETGEIFEKDFRFFVAPSEGKGEPEIRNRKFDVPGWLWSSFERTANVMLTKPRFFMAVTSALFVFVLYLGFKTVTAAGKGRNLVHGHKKQEGYI